jgi:hypothetical protein
VLITSYLLPLALRSVSILFLTQKDKKEKKAKKVKEAADIVALDSSADEAESAAAVASPKKSKKRPREEAVDVSDDEAAAPATEKRARSGSDVGTVTKRRTRSMDAAEVIRIEIDAKAGDVHPSLDTFNISEASKVQLRKRGIESLFPIQVRCCCYENVACTLQL